MKSIFTSILIFIITFIFLGCKSPEAKQFLFEDNFETYDIKSTNLGDWTTEGDVQLVDDMAHSGIQSLRFSSSEGYSNRAFIKYKKMFPIAGNAFYGSMYLYVTEASPDGIHWTMIEGSGQIAETSYRADVRYGGQHYKKLMGNYDTQGIKSDCWHHSEVVIPEQKWTKYQWYFNGNTNTMKLWVDDVLIDRLTIIDKGSGCVSDEMQNRWQFPVFDVMTLGWVDYQSDGGQREVWIDDVVFWIEDN